MAGTKAHDTESGRGDGDWTLLQDVATLAQHWERPFSDTLRIVLQRGLRDCTSRAVCRDCGCTDDDPCVDDSGQPCSWAADDLCSVCAAVNSREQP